MTNTLSYYDTVLITSVKTNMVQAVYTSNLILSMKRETNRLA
jgi:hypothetical protein